jgi:hypothetical protein
MGEDDSNEKYGARDRSGSILRMLAIYFGVETSSSRLPLPLSIQVCLRSVRLHHFCHAAREQREH